MRGLRGLRKGRGARGLEGLEGGEGFVEGKKEIGSRLGGHSSLQSDCIHAANQFVESYICKHTSTLSAFFIPSTGKNFTLVTIRALS